LLSAAAIRELIAGREGELRLALRVTFAATLAYATAVLLSLAQGYWVVITAIIVMQASLGGSLKAAADRMAGTLAGAAYGALIAVLVPHQNSLALGGAIALVVAPMALLAALKASFRIAPVTALIVLVPVSGHVVSPFLYAMERVGEIALGNIIGVAVALFVLPTRAHGVVARSAARVLALNAELMTVLIGGLTTDAGRPSIAALHASIRAALKAMEAAAEEAGRERRGHLTDRPDPEPLVRILYRVRHDLVMIGRAAVKPLPEGIEPELRDCVLALRDAAVGTMQAARAVLESARGAVTSEAFDTALRDYVARMDELRAAGRTRALPSEDVGRLYALRFAFEQLQLDLRDLAGRVGEVTGAGALA
jgi:uncharacterized membrane protein YccC